MKVTSFVFVIDTDRYAGNFERDMTAWITGHIGDCDVGREYTAAACDALSRSVRTWIDDYIDQEPDEHGCHRPCVIWETPGTSGVYNSVGIFFSRRPPKKVIEAMKERARTFNDRPAKYSWGADTPTITGFRLCRKTVVTTTKTLCTYPA